MDNELSCNEFKNNILSHLDRKIMMFDLELSRVKELYSNLLNQNSDLFNQNSDLLSENKKLKDNNEDLQLKLINVVLEFSNYKREHSLKEHSSK